MSDRIVKVCLQCRNDYSQFYLRCPFCGSANAFTEPEWVVRPWLLTKAAQ